MDIIQSLLQHSGQYTFKYFLITYLSINLCPNAFYINEMYIRMKIKPFTHFQIRG